MNLLTAGRSPSRFGAEGGNKSMRDKHQRPQTEQGIGFGQGRSDFNTQYDAHDEDVDEIIANTNVPAGMRESIARQRAQQAAQGKQRQMQRIAEVAAEGDDMAGFQPDEMTAEDYIAQTKETPEIRAYYEAWDKKRKAIQDGFDSGDPDDFDDTIAHIRANSGDPKFMRMLHPQTKWMAQAYEDALQKGKTPEQAREDAYEVGSYRYMDEEIMKSLNRTGQEIMAGAGLMFGQKADATTYNAIANDPTIPAMYKERILTRIARNGTDLATDIGMAVTPVGRIAGVVRSAGKGALQGANAGKGYLGQLGAGAVIPPLLRGLRSRAAM